jgi:hypothetical protein
MYVSLIMLIAPDTKQGEMVRNTTKYAHVFLGCLLVEVGLR